VNIKPQTVLLTSGQAVTFAAIDAAGQPAAVSWSLNPLAKDNGTLVPPVAGTPSSSVTYVAPPLVTAAQTIAVVASTASDSASATISLTPIAIVPAKVDLKAGQQQRFFLSLEAVPPGSPSPMAVPPGATETTTWILSPLLGSLDEKTGLYQAPNEILESATVNVIATTPRLGKLGIAIVNLIPAPWQGLGVNILGSYLLVVFLLVFLIVGFWPPALPSPDTAKANRIDAERTLESALDRLKSANPANPQAANSTAGGDVLIQQVKEARADLKKKQEVEEEVNDTDVHTRLLPHINRELDLLGLVLLAGALGSFLHVAQSFSEYVGNRTIKASWAWWYSLGPFIGAGLALVFYAAIRGGFMAITTGSNAKVSELNPFGVVSVAAMVGMFSKAATVKLGEVFDTLFKSDKAKESKDPLVGSSQTSTQAAGKAGVGGGTASTGTK